MSFVLACYSAAGSARMAKPPVAVGRFRFPPPRARASAYALRCAVRCAPSLFGLTRGSKPAN